MALSATAQKAVNDAVEASLKDYKTKVADKVKHYMDTGDLCSDEASRIREDLELDEFLPRHAIFKCEIYGDMEYTHDSGNQAMATNDSFLAEAISDALLKVLKEGVEVEIKNRYFQSRNTEGFKGKVKFTDPALNDYSLEDDQI